MDRNQAFEKVKHYTEGNMTTRTLPFLVLVEEPLYNALAILEFYNLNREP